MSLLGLLVLLDLPGRFVRCATPPTPPPSTSPDASAVHWARQRGPPRAVWPGPSAPISGARGRTFLPCRPRKGFLRRCWALWSVPPRAAASGRQWAKRSMTRYCSAGAASAVASRLGCAPARNARRRLRHLRCIQDIRNTRGIRSTRSRPPRIGTMNEHSPGSPHCV